MAIKKTFFVKIISCTYKTVERGHIHSPSGAQESPRQSRWDPSTEHVRLPQESFLHTPLGHRSQTRHFLQKIDIILATNIILECFFCKC